MLGVYSESQPIHVYSDAGPKPEYILIYVVEKVNAIIC